MKIVCMRAHIHSTAALVGKGGPRGLLLHAGLAQVKLGADRKGTQESRWDRSAVLVLFPSGDGPH